MRAELLSVGTELLLGEITDTNAAYLARILAEAGVDLFFKQTVGDNVTRLGEAVRLALTRAELILITGGLGPTEDDLTVATVAATLTLPMLRDEEVAETIRAFFEIRRRPAPPSVYKQALVPAGAHVIPNRRGTAPGVVVTHDGATIVMMPGVPSEMEGMVEEFLLPWLSERTGETVIRSRVLKVTGLGESAVEERIKDLLRLPAPTIAPYAKLGEVHLRLTAKGSPAEVEAHLTAGEAAVRDRLGDMVFGRDDDSLEAVTGRLLLDRSITVAVGESCTGGLIADRLTALPGSSAYFRQGAVAYSNQAKTALLGVPVELIERHGAVSAPVAEAMARGAREGTDSDLGVGVTGIAGPAGGSPEKPIGLVFITLADRASAASREWRFGEQPGRRGIRFLASQAALDLIRLHLLRS
ncbi:MAG TPA: competence/damage-inducible protein A [bacterium]|nr:competence/damage-inducible protein A [bacterium]